MDPTMSSSLYCYECRGLCVARPECSELWLVRDYYYYYNFLWLKHKLETAGNLLVRITQKNSIAEEQS